MSDLWNQAADRLGAPALVPAPPQSAAGVTYQRGLFAIDSAIRFAGGELGRFLQSRDGLEARRLLAAMGTHERIELGHDKGENHYAVAFLDGATTGTGLRKATTYTDSRADTNEEISAINAARFFAYYGPGDNNADKIRKIIAWLTAELDNRAEAVLAK